MGDSEPRSSEDGLSDGPPEGSSGGPSRRAVLGAAGAGALALGGGIGFGAHAIAADGPPPAPDVAQLPVGFEGEHQAGITTPAQDRLHLAVFDVTTDDREQLAGMLRAWTDAARKMTAGSPVGKYGAVAGPEIAPPEDTGEALGLPASALTLTIGFGPTLFTENGRDRFGIAAQRPELLEELPRFAGDQLQPEISGGDIVVQACANDPQVAVHAIRNLTRIAFGTASVRYAQLGFGRTSSTSTTQATPRNLLGYKDGTANVKSEDDEAVRDWVWVPEGEGPAWMAGGSYLVTRKIMMRIETWDRESLAGQDRIIGRSKGSGAPLSGGDEFTEVDLTKTGRDGEPLIAPRSHVHLAHPEVNGGARLLRRGYNFVEGADGLGRLAAGLFFICYQRDPRRQFVAIQRSLAGPTHDLLNEYIVHVGSGIFACPGGVGPRGFWGDRLFA